MHGVNLDLLRLLPHHPDGRPKDPHAQHRAEVAALDRAARKALWQARLTRLRALFSRQAATRLEPCTNQRP